MSAPHVGDVITTVVQLYALPRRTLVAHDSGWGIEFARRATDDGRWYVPGSNESIVGEVLLPAVIVLPPDAMPRPERGVKAEALREAASLLYADDGPRNPLSTATWLRQRAEDLEAAVTP